MWLRKLAALAIPLTFLACGGGSTPVAPAPASAGSVLDLVSGTYTLTVAMSRAGVPTCTNGFCTSVSLCGGVGVETPPSLRPLSTLVRVDRSADAITVHPEDSSASFRMNFRITGNSVTGTASGQFRDVNEQVSLVVGAGQSGAIATGTLLTGSVAGRIDGQIGVDGYSCSNNGHTWTLEPR